MCVGVGVGVGVGVRWVEEAPPRTGWRGSPVVGMQALESECPASKPPSVPLHLVCEVGINNSTPPRAV